MDPLPTKQKTPHWDVDDALALRNFLATSTGVRTLEWLKFWAPVLLDGSHVNRTLVASGEVKGYTSAIDHLISLTKDNPIQELVTGSQTEEYPDLDDDTKWDGVTEKRD